MVKELRFILIVLLNLNYSLNISCQISSFQSGDWTQTSTWVGGVVPTRTDNVIIKSNHTVEITSGRDVRSIEIESNAILKLSNGSIVRIYPGFIATQNFVNNGIVDGPGTLKIYGYTYFSGNGIFENDIQYNIPWYMYFDSNCDLVLNNSLIVTGGGKVEIKSGSKLTLTGSSVFYTNSRMNNYGTLELQNANFCNAGLPSTTVLRNFLGSKIIYNYSGEIKMPTEGFMVGTYYSHFYDVEILNTLSSDADMKVYKTLKVDGTLTHSASGLNVEFNGGTSGSFSGSGTANLKRLHNNQVLGLSLTCSNINIDEILYNSNSRITTNTSSNVTLKSDVNSSSGMLKVGSSSEFVGNLTVERYFSISTLNGGWINIASPIENTSMASLALATGLSLCGDFTGANFSHIACGNFTSLYFYDESLSAGTFANGWNSASAISSYSTSNTLSSGNAPFVWAGPNANKISISGSPELDNSSVSVTKTGSSSTEDGWNLISNPFPCSIDWDAFRARNSTINSSAYAYSPSNGNWSSISSGGSIPHSQSIFVQTSSNSTVNFNLADLSSSYDANFARSFNGINSPLAIKIVGDVNSYNDEIYLNTGASFSTSYDVGYDVGKLLTPIPDFAPNIYFLDSMQNKISNNYINNNQSVSIPMEAVFGTYAHGNYTISFDNLPTFMIGACVSLEDLHNGIITDLRMDSSYTFLSDTNSPSPRFLIHINTAYNINVTNSTCFNDSSGFINLDGNNIDGSTFKLFNSQGILIDSTIALNNSVFFGNLHAGNYSIFTDDSNSCSLINHNIIISEPQQIIADFLFPSDTFYLDTSHTTVEVVFSNRSTGSVEYLWDFDNGNFSSDENPTQSFFPGNYMISLTSFLDSTHNCLSTINKLITVIDSSAISNLNKVSSSINYQIHDQKLFIHLDNKILSNDEKLEIFDLSGKLILSKLIPIEENQIFINLKDLRNGIYIFKLYDNSVKFYKI